MPLSIARSYEPPKRYVVIKLKCLAISQCREYLRGALTSTKGWGKYYNARILDCKQITNQNEVKKRMDAADPKSPLYSVDVEICKHIQPIGLKRKLFGMKFNNIALGLCNYGMKNGNPEYIWYILDEMSAARAKGRQKEYRERKASGRVNTVKRGGKR